MKKTDIKKIVLAYSGGLDNYRRNHAQKLF